MNNIPTWPDVFTVARESMTTTQEINSQLSAYEMFMWMDAIKREQATNPPTWFITPETYKTIRRFHPFHAHMHKVSHRRRAVAMKRAAHKEQIIRNIEYLLLQTHLRRALPRAQHDPFNVLHQNPNYWARVKAQHTLARGGEK